MNKCNTKTEPILLEDCNPQELKLGEELEKGLARLEKTFDLDESARSSGALVRRRGVGSAHDLLRIVMGYSVLDWSLRMLGMWCVTVKLCNISKTALLHRLRNCQIWLGQLIVKILLQQRLAFPTGMNIRTRMFDASVICEPGSKGSDWRLHLGFDLGWMGMDWLQITDGHGGENMTRFPVAAGELWIGDRAYALASSVGHVLAGGAWILVRAGWRKLPFEQENGQRWDVIAWLKKANLVPAGDPQETKCWVTTPNGRFPLRLIARAIPEEAAESARRKMRREASKKGKTVDARSLYAAGFILLLTNLPLADWGMTQILQLYRFRWQIELAFKRLKSLLNLDGLRTRDPQLVQVYLLSKLLAALMLERLQGQIAQQYPDWFTDTHRPLSLWRLTALLWDHFRSTIRGNITLDQIMEVFPLLRRYLCDEPRKRVSQRAHAQAIFSGLCG